MSECLSISPSLCVVCVRLSLFLPPCVFVSVCVRLSLSPSVCVCVRDYLCVREWVTISVCVRGTGGGIVRIRGI